MAIVERTTTTTRTHIPPQVERDEGITGILVALAVIVALAAAYFAYDYYAAPMDETVPVGTTIVDENSRMTTSPAPATEPTTVPAGE